MSLDLVNRIQDKEEYLWAVAEGAGSITSAILGAAPGGELAGELLGHAIKVGAATLEVRKTAASLYGGLEPNPNFVLNGIEGGFERTRRYQISRTAKNLLGAAIGVGSKAATSATVVDVGGILKEGQALGLTTVHAVKLQGIARRHRQSETIAGWIDLLLKLKAIKAATRTAGLVGASIPYAAVGVVTDCLQAAAKIGVKLRYDNVAGRTAMEIHWRAYCEQKLARGIGGQQKGPGGPASSILHELFTKRGATRIFGKHDIDTLIAEPTGWIAVKDKVMLI